MMSARSYCLTINNPFLEEEVALTSLKSSYLIFQYEKGLNDTPHIQAYIVFPNSMRFATLKQKLPRAHIEIAKGNADQNIKYCSKSAGRLDGPYEYGTRPSQGKRSDLIAVTESIAEGKSLMDITADHPVAFIKFHSGIKSLMSLLAKGREALGVGKPVVRVYYGLPGSGKSHLAKQDAAEIGDCYYLHKSGANYWWDGYVGQPVVIVNDFYGHYPYSELLNLLDVYDNKVNIKGSHAQFVSKLIIFTSNKHPNRWYKVEITGEWSHEFNPVKNALERRIDLIREFSQVWVPEASEP